LAKTEVARASRVLRRGCGSLAIHDILEYFRKKSKTEWANLDFGGFTFLPIVSAPSRISSTRKHFQGRGDERERQQREQLLSMERKVESSIREADAAENKLELVSIL
jgi:hypothetical protein